MHVVWCYCRWHIWAQTLCTHVPAAVCGCGCEPCFVECFVAQDLLLSLRLTSPDMDLTAVSVALSRWPASLLQLSFFHSLLNSFSDKWFFKFHNSGLIILIVTSLSKLNTNSFEITLSSYHSLWDQLRWEGRAYLCAQDVVWQSTLACGVMTGKQSRFTAVQVNSFL